MQKIAHNDDYSKSRARNPGAAERVRKTFADYIAREPLRISKRGKVSWSR